MPRHGVTGYLPPLLPASSHQGLPAVTHRRYMVMKDQEGTSIDTINARSALTGDFLPSPADSSSACHGTHHARDCVNYLTQISP